MLFVRVYSCVNEYAFLIIAAVCPLWIIKHGCDSGGCNGGGETNGGRCTAFVKNVH